MAEFNIKIEISKADFYADFESIGQLVRWKKSKNSAALYFVLATTERTVILTTEEEAERAGLLGPVSTEVS